MNDGNKFLCHMFFSCGKDMVATVTMNKVAFITFLPFILKYFCRYKTPY